MAGFSGSPNVIGYGGPNQAGSPPFYPDNSGRDSALGAALQQGYAYPQQTKLAQIQADAQTLPARLQQQRFNTTFPWLQQQFGVLNNELAGQFGAGSAGSAGAAGNQPRISAAPVYSPGQVQQQVNTMRAGNDAHAASQTREAQQGAAGRGLGGNSPLAQALGAQYQGQALQANTAGETQTRLGAAQANSQQVLAGQTAQENQFASRQAEALKARQIQAQQQSALYAALAGII